MDDTNCSRLAGVRTYWRSLAIGGKFKRSSVTCLAVTKETNKNRSISYFRLPPFAVGGFQRSTNPGPGERANLISSFFKVQQGHNTYMIYSHSHFTHVPVLSDAVSFLLHDNDDSNTGQVWNRLLGTTGISANMEPHDIRTHDTS